MKRLELTSTADDVTDPCMVTITLANPLEALQLAENLIHQVHCEFQNNDHEPISFSVVGKLNDAENT